MNSVKRSIIAIAALTALVAASSLVAQDAAKTQSLTRVDAKYTCFVTKHRFDKEQLPVSVDGKTYYGCCEMCKAKLKGDPAMRYDVDPVSGNKVDKATAVIGADENGKIYFFENEADMSKFHPDALAGAGK